MGTLGAQGPGSLPHLLCPGFGQGRAPLGPCGREAGLEVGSGHCVALLGAGSGVPLKIIMRATFGTCVIGCQPLD